MRFKITVEDYGPSAFYRLYQRRWFKWKLIHTALSYDSCKRIAVVTAAKSREVNYERFRL